MLFSYRKLRTAKSARANKRSLRSRVYSGLVSRAGVTKTSVFVRIFSASTLPRLKVEDNAESNKGMELDDAKWSVLQSGDIPYREV